MRGSDNHHFLTESSMGLLQELSQALGELAERIDHIAVGMFDADTDPEALTQIGLSLEKNHRALCDAWGIGGSPAPSERGLN